MLRTVTVPELRLTERLSSAFPPTKDWASAACLAREYWAAKRAVKRLNTIIARTMKKRAPMISAWALLDLPTFISLAEPFLLKGGEGLDLPRPTLDLYCTVTVTTWVWVAPLANVAATVMV